MFSPHFYFDFPCVQAALSPLIKCLFALCAGRTSSFRASSSRISNFAPLFLASAEVIVLLFGYFPPLLRETRNSPHLSFYPIPWPRTGVFAIYVKYVIPIFYDFDHIFYLSSLFFCISSVMNASHDAQMVPSILNPAGRIFRLWVRTLP